MEARTLERVKGIEPSLGSYCLTVALMDFNLLVNDIINAKCLIYISI